MTDTTVTGLFTDNWASGHHRQPALQDPRRRSTVLATGSFDQPLVFRNNDLPGILFADAAQRLMRLYGVRPGRRAVVVDRQPLRLRGRARPCRRRRRGGGDRRPQPRRCAGKAPAEAQGAGHPHPCRLAPSWRRAAARHVEAVAVARITGRGTHGRQPANGSTATSCDERRLHAGPEPRQPCRRQGRLRRGPIDAPGERPAGWHQPDRLGGGPVVGAVVAEAARHAGRSAAASALGRKDGGAEPAACRPGGRPRHASLADLHPLEERQGLHRFRRGPQYQGHPEHRGGRL